MQNVKNEPRPKLTGSYKKSVYLAVFINTNLCLSEHLSVVVLHAVVRETIKFCRGGLMFSIFMATSTSN